MARLILKHIETWPREQTKNREWSKFRRSTTSNGYRRDEIPWTETQRDLLRELDAIRVREAVMQLAVKERDIRLDGGLRSDAKPSHPGVILSFVHPKQGPVMFACDKWVTWQANIRGITKALEALRLVDRYGITSSGEQYAGWKELPSGDDLTPEAAAMNMTVEEAARIVAGAISGAHDLNINARTAIDDEDYRRYAYKQAVKLAHPDQGGSHDAFLRLQTAMDVLTENDAL